MGAAVSSNTAKSIATVSNKVSNATTVSDSQVNAVQQQIDFDDCFLDMSGDINIQSASKMVAKSKQIVTALQQSHIQNTIAQQMMQQAKSQMGFLGVGFAEASNYASQMTDASSEVVNQLTTVANQFNYIDQGFRCEGSTFIGKNFLLSQGSSANFFSEQVVKNQQISSIANDITQSITQKATATVSGMSAFLLIFVLLIASCGYVLSKPLSSGSGKIIISTVMVIGIGVLIAVGFIFAWPPLFQKPNLCALTPFKFMPQTCKDPCIKATQQTIDVLAPTPFKFPIFDTPIEGGIKPDGTVVIGSLAGMAIAQQGAYAGPTGTNMGLNAAAAASLITDWNNFWQKDDQNGTAGVCITVNDKSISVYDLVENVAGSLAPMFIPTTSDTQFYKIPDPYLQSTGNDCTGACAGLAFTLTGITNTVHPSGNSKNYTPAEVSCSDNLTIGPIGPNNLKPVYAKNSYTIYSICPVDSSDKQAKDSATGDPLQCGCSVLSSLPSGDESNYNELVAESPPVPKGQSWINLQEPVLSKYLAEVVDNADITKTLEQWGPPTQVSKLDPGWLARFVRTFYYTRLDLNSTCYWDLNDLVLVELNNTTKNGKPDSSYSGQRWVTAGQAMAGKMCRFTSTDDGKTWTKSGVVIGFDPVACYKLEDAGGDTVKVAVKGLNTKGDRLSISGLFGICNDRTYQFGLFTQRIGIYIAIGIVVIAIFFVLLDHGIQRTHGASFENPNLVASSSGGKEDSGDNDAGAI
jgi:hypothetical protein